MRYTVANVQKVIEQLTEWEEQAEETLDTANNQQYPNEERIENLETRLNSLQDAKSALEEIE